MSQFIDVKEVEKEYRKLPELHKRIRKERNISLTLTEKILFSHVQSPDLASIERGVSDLELTVDRVAMQDATAQMALLQFMTAGIERTVVPSTVHCDHLILAKSGFDRDLPASLDSNREVFEFLRTISSRYGIGFWRPGSGIIHQVVLENYAVPSFLMVGTDSHTPNAGGLGMLAIGVGGADAVDVMTGQPFGLRMPKIVGYHLKGKLKGWSSPKDIIIKVNEIMTVQGGTGKVVEYFGEGTDSISCTGKGTVTNMGAEIGATTSIFPFDERMAQYLEHTQREDLAQLTREYAEYLKPDPEVLKHPEKYFDEIHEIDLSSLEPQISGPHSPDRVRPISRLAKDAEENNYPERLSAVLIGSCTNSSYEDLSRAVSIARQGIKHGLKMQSQFLVTPGSDQIYETVSRDGILEDFKKVGGTVLSNACGPCIGQWDRDPEEKKKENNILTSFNRNFRKRNDGSPNTNGFIASPEVVVAMGFSGKINFNPLTDSLKTKDGKEIRLEEPKGDEFPSNGFVSKKTGYVQPEGNSVEVRIDSKSERLAFLTPFPAPEFPKDFQDMRILLKAQGKCTTDHVSPAGPWLRYRGHLDAISRNMYLGAVNAFNEKTGLGINILSGEQDLEFHVIARNYQSSSVPWVVVADANYGEGSSREHAAMEPRHLGCKAILARSFARIAETNLKKQGVLPLYFIHSQDYDLFQKEDRLTLEGVDSLQSGRELAVKIEHSDSSTHRVALKHSLNEQQIQWFYAGSALNFLKNSK